MSMRIIILLCIVLPVMAAVRPVPILNIRPIREASTDGPIMQVYNVTSLIQSRYAITTITTQIYNPSVNTNLVDFSVLLPDNAYISNFTMRIGEDSYRGIALEKEEARKNFTAQVENNINTGLVESRGMNEFSIVLAVTPNSTAVFHLTYQQLLIRSLGIITQTINIQPNSVVPNLNVNITVVESQEFNTFSYSNHFDEDTNIKSNTRRTVLYSPTPNEQIALINDDDDDGINLDLFVSYDVKRSDDSNSVGYVLFNDGYFVHYFVPVNYGPWMKSIVFVMDVSGSMSGTKIEQTRVAINSIIDKLSYDDYANIVTFNSNTIKWSSYLRSVNAGTITELKQFADAHLTAGGGTNIDNALSVGLDILIDGLTGNERTAVLILMSDGKGTNPRDTVLSNVRNKIMDRPISLNTMAFGASADIELMRALALQNHGKYIRVYEGADGADQLISVYDQVLPVLTQLSCDYSDGKIATTTDNTKQFFYSGDEFIVAGKLSSNANGDFPIIVHGNRGATEISYSQTKQIVNTVELSDLIEKLYAYKTIRAGIDALSDLTNQTLIDSTTQYLTDLAIQYNFVTDLTSLVIISDQTNDNSNNNNNNNNNNDNFENSDPMVNSVNIGGKQNTGNPVNLNIAYASSGVRSVSLSNAIVLCLIAIITIMLS